MKILFETKTTGHHIEYIHHLYMMILKKKENDYIIVVPEDFKMRCKQYEWPVANHIRFDFVPLEKIDKLQNTNLLTSSYRRSKLLHYYVRKYQATDVLLVTFMHFIPFLPLLIPKKVNVTGIIYKIYLYEWKSYSILRKILEIIKYKIITANNCVKNVLILNDNSAAHALNRLYDTQKFKYLVDPYNEIHYIPKDIRNELNIPSGNKIFLHIGSMNRRKGTLKVLHAMSLLSDDVTSNVSLVIAGIVCEDIKKEFYELLANAKSSCQIIVFDKYCSKEFIADLCQTCDFILIPYGNTAQSSGIIAHAAYYKKPVIGPCGGLIGKLIRKYKLGISLKNSDITCIVKSIETVSPYNTNSSYCRIATISFFQQQMSLFF